MKAKKPGRYPSVVNGSVELKEIPAADLETVQPMIRTQIYLTRNEHDFVRSEANRRQEPIAAVIRGFIDEKMKLPDDAWTNNPMLEPSPRDPNFSLPEDAAVNHDHYLYGVPKKYVKRGGRWVLAKEAGH